MERRKNSKAFCVLLPHLRQEKRKKVEEVGEREREKKRSFPSSLNKYK